MYWLMVKLYALLSLLSELIIDTQICYSLKGWEVNMIICSPYINLSTATLFSFSILLTWTQCIWHRSFICTYILLLCDADVLSNQITYICHTHTVLYTLMVTISFYWNAYKAHILLLIDFSLSKLVNHKISRTKWTNGYH